MAPPLMEATADAAAIDQAAVHDGSIDRDYIARMEGEARGGNAKANEKAALAHHAAAQFELAHGDMEHALGDERTAITYLPEQPVLLMNVAYLYLKKSEFKQAVEYLERAKRVAPDNADIYKLEGWAYYGMNRPDQAVAEWKKSLALKPDSDTQAALDKALRDKEEEENYKENESAHFQLNYNGTAEPVLARDVLRVLETHYSTIESELNYTPPEPIGVVLYTQQEFADITRAPGWVGALNDGRIRVPVQGLTSVDAELSRVLKHELTHSFIQQKTRGRAPTWIQEGVAQWMEGKRSDENAAVLVQVYDAGAGGAAGSAGRILDGIACGCGALCVCVGAGERGIHRGNAGNGGHGAHPGSDCGGRVDGRCVEGSAARRLRRSDAIHRGILEEKLWALGLHCPHLS